MSSERQLRYQNTEKGKIVARRAQHKYGQSEKGKDRTTRYVTSEKGQATLRRYQLRRRHESLTAGDRA